MDFAPYRLFSFVTQLPPGGECELSPCFRKAVFKSGSLSAKAKKAPYWVPFALAERERFELSERY